MRAVLGQASRQLHVQDQEPLSFLDAGRPVEVEFLGWREKRHVLGCGAVDVRDIPVLAADAPGHEEQRHGRGGQGGLSGFGLRQELTQVLGHRIGREHLGTALGQVEGDAVKRALGAQRGAVMFQHTSESLRAVQKAGCAGLRGGEECVPQEGTQQLKLRRSQGQVIASRVEIVARLLDGLGREAVAVQEAGHRTRAGTPYLVHVLSAVEGLEQPHHGSVGEELETARAQRENHSRVGIGEALAQVAETLVKLGAILELVCGEHLPDVRTASTRAILHEPVVRDGAVSAQVADADFPVSALLRQQPRQNRHACALRGRIGHRAVVGDEELHRDLRDGKLAHDLVRSRQRAKPAELVITDVVGSVGSAKVKGSLCISHRVLRCQPDLVELAQAEGTPCCHDRLSEKPGLGSSTLIRVASWSADSGCGAGLQRLPGPRVHSSIRAEISLKSIRYDPTLHSGAWLCAASFVTFAVLRQSIAF